jgi:hypothetical protein
MPDDPNIFPPISKEHAAAIGHVAANWSLIEGQTANLTYNLLSLHAPAGHAVTAEMGMIQSGYLVKALIALTGNEAWIIEWDEIAVVLEDLRNRRNDAVHSEWSVHADEHFGLRRKAKGRVRVTLTPMPTRTLEGLVREIKALEDRMARFSYVVIVGGAPALINRLDPPGLLLPPPPSRARPRSRKQNAPVRTRALKREQKQLRRLKAETELKRRAAQPKKKPS